MIDDTKGEIFKCRETEAMESFNRQDDEPIEEMYEVGIAKSGKVEVLERRIPPLFVSTT